MRRHSNTGGLQRKTLQLHPKSRWFVYVAFGSSWAWRFCHDTLHVKRSGHVCSPTHDRTFTRMILGIRLQELLHWELWICYNEEPISVWCYWNIKCKTWLWIKKNNCSFRWLQQWNGFSSCLCVHAVIISRIWLHIIMRLAELSRLRVCGDVYRRSLISWSWWEHTCQQL